MHQNQKDFFFARFKVKKKKWLPHYKLIRQLITKSNPTAADPFLHKYANTFNAWISYSNISQPISTLIDQYFMNALSNLIMPASM